jgi:pimeloyl-ACP methyl ester carboxylesterase
MHRAFITLSAFALALPPPLSLSLSRMARADQTAGVPSGFRSQTADLGDVKIHYVVGGTGTPLLLIHGWPETWYEFRKMLPALARRHTVIAADLRGAGDSSVPSDGYDKKTLAADLHRLMVKLGHERATVVGHDWGAAVAYAYAAQFRDAVDKLVVAEGAPFGPWMPTTEPVWFFHFLRIPGYAEALVKGRERQFLTYFYRNDEFHVVPAFDDATIDLYVRSFSRPGRMEAGYGLYRTIDTDVKDNAELAKTPLTIPVLAVGAKAGNGELILRFTRATAKNVTGVLMEATGHFIPEERPDALTQLIESFMDGKPIAPEWRLPN